MSAPTLRELSALRAAQAESEHWLKELLAIIHRDGGHYVAEHGIEKAVRSAHEVWAALQQASCDNGEPEPVQNAAPQEEAAGCAGTPERSPAVAAPEETPSEKTMSFDEFAARFKLTQEERAALVWHLAAFRTRKTIEELLCR